jgi:hypothetical protein
MGSPLLCERISYDLFIRGEQESPGLLSENGAFLILLLAPVMLVAGTGFEPVTFRL